MDGSMSKFTNIFLIACILSIDAIVAQGLSMTPQIQRLLDEKQQKIEALEKCEGKKQGWMIAGISTIGLTAVGVVGNIALANKSKNIDSEISNEKSSLNAAQRELDDVNDKIAAEKQRQEESQEENNDIFTVKSSAEVHGAQKPVVTGSAVEKTTPGEKISLSNGDVSLDTSVNGTGRCFRGMQDNSYRGNANIKECDRLDYMDWLVPFPDGTFVRGTSMISKNMPANKSKGVIPDANIQDSLTQEHKDWYTSGHPIPEKGTEYACYCKMMYPYPSDWVFESWASGWTLTDNCALFCAMAVDSLQDFRKILFGK